MKNLNRKIRIAMPSKGLLADKSKELLGNIGFEIHNPNPRQYMASIPNMPEVEVIFQRPGDIVVSVRDGSVDFGITGRDIFLEKRDDNGNIVSDGGRVLCAVGLGADLGEAQQRAYELVDNIRWESAYFRTDIGFKAL